MTDGWRLVLVVDDDQAVRHSLKFALELEGLEVRVFAELQGLLADPVLARAGCVVLDHDIPNSGGIKSLAALTKRNPTVPVIFMTDHANDSLRRLADAAGVRHIVEKPLLNGALVEAIRDVLARGPASSNGIS